MKRVAERPDDVRMRDRKYRFDEAERSASSFSVSLPSGGPLKALPGPGSRRFQRAPAVEEDGLSARHALLPSTTPTAGGSGQQPDPRTGRVSPSTPVPLDHTPPPQWSLALRPFLATRWVQNTGDFQGAASIVWAPVSAPGSVTLNKGRHPGARPRDPWVGRTVGGSQTLKAQRNDGSREQVPG